MQLKKQGIKKRRKADMKSLTQIQEQQRDERTIKLI